VRAQAAATARSADRACRKGVRPTGLLSPSEEEVYPLLLAGLSGWKNGGRAVRPGGATSCRACSSICTWSSTSFRAALGSRGDLIAENLLLRQQLAVLTRPTRRRPRLRARDRLVWTLAGVMRRDWRRHLVLVRPATVVRWHRQRWRLFWRWKSRCRLGRPRLSAEVRELIATMATANPAWGSERIVGELLKLGIAVSKRSVQQCRRRGPARPPSQTWRTFLRNHRPMLWAADLLTVQTLTFQTLYVLVFISHARRELVHLNLTAHPTAAWVWRQLIAATPWGRSPRYLVRDRDAVYGRDFVERARRLGVETVLTPVRAQRANAIAERVVGTLRRECLDHLVIVNEAHLRTVLTEFVRYYNLERPHRALELETPTPPVRAAAGPISCRPVLGGLHHSYQRAA
jgi:transposase InsO family protein